MKLRKIAKRILGTGHKTFGILMGLYPAFLFFGVRVRFSKDFLQATLYLPVRWYFRNGHGTIFGGAILAASDPFPAIMFSKNLPWALTWTRGHEVEFLKPGKKRLRGIVNLTLEEIEEARQQLVLHGNFRKTYHYHFLNEENEIIALVHSTVHMRNPRHSRYTSKTNANTSSIPEKS
jgi:acyl-coenzyme A thioesterase PaaI-like protein